MSDWQPARFKLVHPVGLVPEAADWFMHHVIWVRPWEGIGPTPESLEERGGECQAAQYFQIHPNDANSAYGFIVDAPCLGCEHEILTD